MSLTRLPRVAAGLFSLSLYCAAATFPDYPVRAITDYAISTSQSGLILAAATAYAPTYFSCVLHTGPIRTRTHRTAELFVRFNPPLVDKRSCLDSNLRASLENPKPKSCYPVLLLAELDARSDERNA